MSESKIKVKVGTMPLPQILRTSAGHVRITISPHDAHSVFIESLSCIARAEDAYELSEIFKQLGDALPASEGEPNEP